MAGQNLIWHQYTSFSTGLYSFFVCFSDPFRVYSNVSSHPKRIKFHRNRFCSNRANGFDIDKVNSGLTEPNQLLRKLFTSEEKAAWKDLIQVRCKNDVNTGEQFSQSAFRNRSIVPVDLLDCVINMAGKHPNLSDPSRLTEKLYSSEEKASWKAVVTADSSEDRNNILQKFEIARKRAEEERSLFPLETLDSVVVPCVTSLQIDYDAWTGTDNSCNPSNPIVLPRVMVVDEISGWTQHERPPDNSVWRGSRVSDTTLISRTQLDTFALRLDLEAKNAIREEKTNLETIGRTKIENDSKTSRREDFKPIRYRPGPTKKTAYRRAHAQDMIKWRREMYFNLRNVRNDVADSLNRLSVPQMYERFSLVNSVDKTCLGEGQQGVVNSIVEVATNRTLAVKTCNKFKKFWKKEDIGSVRNEVAVLKYLRPHPHLLDFVDTFESPVNIHIITEQCFGGDLFTYLSEKEFEPENEIDACRAVHQILSVLRHCHSQNIAHLDIKLENIMRRKAGSEIDSGGIALIDFGHARELSRVTGSTKGRFLGSDTKLQRPVGSPSYCAPEVVLECVFDDRSDMWSVGVVTFVLLQGYLPFPKFQRKKWQKFTIADYDDPSNNPFRYHEDWAHLSEDACDFCRKLLSVERNKRFNVEQALQHPWMEQNDKNLESIADKQIKNSKSIDQVSTQHDGNAKVLTKRWTVLDMFKW